MDGSVCAAKHEEQNYAAGVMSLNVLRLGEGGDFYHKSSYEAHTSNLRKTVIRSTAPPLLPNRC
ncbi:MAG: hypothetical protein LC115_05545 [Bacteroidia bacterium]|nr:hypothetical protein [Bacteroidia bacterium]